MIILLTAFNHESNFRETFQIVSTSFLYFKNTYEHPWKSSFIDKQSSLVNTYWVHLFISQQVSGQKRAGNFGVVSAAFTSFNKIADFKERCNTVERWFGSIDRFMGSGGVQGESEVTSQLLDSIKTDIEDLASNVEGKLIAPRYAQVFQS